MDTADTFGRWLRSLASGLEQDVDQLKALLTDPVKPGSVQVLPYVGYRNATALRVSGRVIEHQAPLSSAEGVLDKLRAMWTIYNSREVGGITVRCEADGVSATCVSDEEGYFAFDLAIDRPLPPRALWEHVTLSPPGLEPHLPLNVPVLAPGTDDHWGIISDIDDTVMETGATDFAANWRRIILEQPAERLAVPGAADLYRLIARDHAAPTRPFFYVSSSPWNLYGFLTQFMELNRIPHGPMFLKDLGIDAGKFIDAGHKGHKLDAVRTILRFYPEHRFLLMGDNGQQDVEIYAQVVSEFPQRIGAVFIRDVSGECGTGAKAAHLAEMARLGVQTYCAASFADGVSILRALDIDNPVEATRASGEGAAVAAGTEAG
ncbi:phosphatidate phosphatase APP1 [Novosphingobium chloroacetimidivorans]|uniref:Phosphatidate phosphatase APP1 n=1 Tax=Novosphingobium chloroacetimidivorans TaxID=1428314 RepID=A0A7W7NWM8_9SPHN|nr:phosphatase domain-containing protein [Novosphingobium chloroacetimidivorans]MBB4858320.1 phosphatidate phosphatase APP1 [Novosphingobium chloroacetimidivorans]